MADPTVARRPRSNIRALFNDVADSTFAFDQFVLHCSSLFHFSGLSSHRANPRYTDPVENTENVVKCYTGR